MKNVIGKKNNIYLIETLITTLLIIALIVLCIYSAIQIENGIVMLMVFIGFIIICLYFLFLEIKNIYKYLKSSKDIVQEDGEFIWEVLDIPLYDDGFYYGDGKFYKVKDGEHTEGVGILINVFIMLNYLMILMSQS